MDSKRPNWKVSVPDAGRWKEQHRITADYLSPAVIFWLRGEREAPEHNEPSRNGTRNFDIYESPQRGGPWMGRLFAKRDAII